MGGCIPFEEVDDRQLGRGPVIDTRARPGRQPLPGVVGCLTDERVDAPGPGQRLDLLRLRHRQYVTDTRFLQHPANAPLLAIGGISSHPGDGEIGGEHPQDQAPGEFALGRERSVLRESWPRGSGPDRSSRNWADATPGPPTPVPRSRSMRRTRRSGSSPSVRGPASE